MSDTVERLNLDAIESRANAATEGPWVAFTSWSHPDHYTARGMFLADCNKGVVAAWQIFGGYPSDPGEGWQVLGGEVEHGTIKVRDEDLAFVVHARTDIPLLCREVRRLRKQHATDREYIVNLQMRLHRFGQMVNAHESAIGIRPEAQSYQGTASEPLKGDTAAPRSVPLLGGQIRELSPAEQQAETLVLSFLTESGGTVHPAEMVRRVGELIEQAAAAERGRYLAALDILAEVYQGLDRAELEALVEQRVKESG